MKKSWIKTAFFIASVTLVTLTFQNCGSSSHAPGESTESSKISDTDFFAYPYSAKPDFYADVTLLKPATQLSNLSQFTFFGTVRYVSSSISTKYTVKVTTPAGTLICPTHSGTLAAGETSIQFNCASAVLSNIAKVEMKVTANGKSYTVRRDYIE